MVCCCISDEPINDPRGRIRTRESDNKFQTEMMSAPLANGYTTLAWFTGQFLPITCCCTQVLLRRKVLMNDMSKYSCCQGYFNCCCFKSGSLGEESCPLFCLCLESFFCNNLAVSASRMYVMDRYELSSDPCDYRLIRLSNMLQLLSCICAILAIFDKEFHRLAQIIDYIADLMYHVVSSCMTAQTAHEMDYQLSKKNTPHHSVYDDIPPGYNYPITSPMYAHVPPVEGPMGGQYYNKNTTTSAHSHDPIYAQPYHMTTTTTTTSSIPIVKGYTTNDVIPSAPPIQAYPYHDKQYS